MTSAYTPANAPVDAAPLRVLGIDPGLNHTGWAVLERRRAAEPVVLASGVLNPPKDGMIAERLGFITKGLCAVITEHAPTLAAIERVFVNVNPQSTLLLGQARGAAIVACSLSDLAVDEFTPSEIKEAVAGTGRADKLMIAKMIHTRLGVEKTLKPDEADAAAVALCLLQRLPLRALERSGSTSRSYATARRGRHVRAARASWTTFAQDRSKKDSS